MKTLNAEKDQLICGSPPTLPTRQDTLFTQPAHAVVASDPMRLAHAGRPGVSEATVPAPELIRPAVATSGKDGKMPEKAGFSEPAGSPFLLTTHMALNTTPAPYSAPEPPVSRKEAISRFVWVGWFSVI